MHSTPTVGRTKGYSCETSPTDQTQYDQHQNCVDTFPTYTKVKLNSTKLSNWHVKTLFVHAKGKRGKFYSSNTAPQIKIILLTMYTSSVKTAILTKYHQS
jgi:hypothetical protein